MNFCRSPKTLPRPANALPDWAINTVRARYLSYFELSLSDDVSTTTAVRISVSESGNGDSRTDFLQDMKDDPKSTVSSDDDNNFTHETFLISPNEPEDSTAFDYESLLFTTQKRNNIKELFRHGDIEHQSAEMLKEPERSNFIPPDDSEEKSMLQTIDNPTFFTELLRRGNVENKSVESRLKANRMQKST